MKIVIIEDEIKVAQGLKQMIEKLSGDYQVCCMEHSVKEAVNQLNSLPEKPDLILADIVLGDGLSFDIFHFVDLMIPVIFCTAYHQFALEAFQNNGVDYLLKPVEEADLKQSLQKLDRLTNWNTKIPRTSLNKIEREIFEEEAVYSSSVLCYFRNSIIPIPVEKIGYIHIEKRMVLVETGRESYQIKENLERLSNSLDPKMFFRANRQYIINRRFVDKVEKIYGRKLLVTVVVGLPHVVIVSKGKSSEFLKWIKGA